MLMEIDQVLVPRRLWETRDADTYGELAEFIEGLVTYFHNLVIDDGEDYVVVTLRDLEEAGILESVTLRSVVQEQAIVSARKEISGATRSLLKAMLDTFVERGTEDFDETVRISLHTNKDK